MRVRLKYTKGLNCRFLSHLDLVRTFIRAFRRCGIPTAYTEGFNPQPRLSFAAPLSVGVISEGEHLDLTLAERLEVKELIPLLNKSLPEGIQILDGIEISQGEESLMAIVSAGLYNIYIEEELEEVKKEVDKINSQDMIISVKETKKGLRERDIKPLIYHLELKKSNENGQWWLEMLLALGSKGSLRPEEVLKFMGLSVSYIIRKGMFIKEGEKLLTPFEFAERR